MKYISTTFICFHLHSTHSMSWCININLKKKIIIISFWTLLPHHLNYKCDLVMSDFQQKRHTIWRFISRTVDQTSQIVFCSASSLDSLPSCNLQRQCTQTRCTTINSIQCLFSCSMWHQNVNWFCLLSYMQTKKKKINHRRNKIATLVIVI